MRFATTVVLSGLAAVAAAQSSTASAAASTSTCDAQYIVDACLTSEQAKVDSCGDNDWVCLCYNYQNVLTCYNNCPGDIQKSTVQSQVTAYCNAAAPILASSSAAAATQSKVSSTAAAATGDSTTLATSASGTAKASGSATVTGLGSSSSTGAASNVVIPAGGFLAAVIAAFL